MNNEIELIKILANHGPVTTTADATVSSISFFHFNVATIGLSTKREL